jgi:hypothetical protein
MQANGLNKHIRACLSIILVLAVLSPSFLKLGHLIHHHKHDVCETSDISQTHFHKLDPDCEFYKFKITNSYFILPSNQNSEIGTNPQNSQSLYYLHIFSHRQIVTFLRGPPSVV